MIFRIFDAVGIWGSIRFGLGVGASGACALWGLFFYDDPSIIYFETVAAIRPASGYELVTLPAIVIGLLAACGIGLFAGLRWNRRKVRRLVRSVESLSAQLDTTEGDLAAERALVARITDGNDAIIRAARGAHHRPQGGAHRG